MSNVLKHKFVSLKADGADTTKLRPSDWDAEHAFSGGALGSILYRDTGESDGASWLADVAVGSVLVSGGVGAAPAWSASPYISGQLGIGAVPYANNALYLLNPNGPGLHIKGGTSSNTRSAIVFENSAGAIRAVFNPEGQFYTNGWMTISGAFTATQNANGDITVFTTGASGLTTMLDVVSDITGPTIVAKATAGGWNFQGLDVSANYTFSIEKDGTVMWGAGSTKGSMDTALARNAAGVLEINNGVIGTFRDLQLRALTVSTNITLTNNIILANNSGILQIKDTGGTARNMLYSDNGNVLRLQQLAAGNFIIKPGSAQQLRVMNNAESAYGLVMFDGTLDLTVGTNTDGNYRLHVARSGSSGTLLAYDSTASTGVTNCVVREGAGQAANQVFGITATDGTTLRFAVRNGDILWGTALVALGGGAAPTLGTIAGTGPTVAGQNSWLRVLDSTGAACWLPVWK